MHFGKVKFYDKNWVENPDNESHTAKTEYPAKPYWDEQQRHLMLEHEKRAQELLASTVPVKLNKKTYYVLQFKSYGDWWFYSNHKCLESAKAEARKLDNNNVRVIKRVTLELEIFKPKKNENQ